MPYRQPPDAWFERANRLATTARLLATAAHDVNNLLQVITGNAELLEARADGDETTIRRTQAIAASARRANRVLEEVRAFARLEALEDDHAALKPIVERSLTLREHMFRRLRAEKTIACDHVVARANPIHVQQIVLNLLMNAEQALASGTGARLGVTVAERDGRAEVTVADNGRGLPEGQSPENWPSAGDGDALGIGLAVSRAIAVRMGGQLAVTAPEAGQGCVATLSLPLAES